MKALAAELLAVQQRKLNLHQVEKELDHLIRQPELDPMSAQASRGYEEEGRQGSRKGVQVPVFVTAALKRK